MNMLITTGPHLYDRWEDQVALEEEMLSLGKDRMKSKIEKARMAHDMTALRPYRSLIHEWVLPVSKFLSEWCEAQTKKRGVRPIALPLLQDMDHDAVAVCALKTILRMMGVKRRGVMAVAYEIGTWVEHEARAAAWIEADEGNFRGLEHNQKAGGSNSTHIRRARISIFNKHVSEKIEWENWTDEERRRVGLQMVDIVIQATRRFSIMPDPEWTPPPNAKVKPKSRPLILEGDTELMNWLGTKTLQEILRHENISTTELYLNVIGAERTEHARKFMTRPEATIPPPSQTPAGDVDQERIQRAIQIFKSTGPTPEEVARFTMELLK